MMSDGKVKDPQSELLKACWVETTDKGPYPAETIAWAHALSADRFYAMLRIRGYTLGEEYPFKVICPVCENKFEWSLNLSDLPVRKIPAESLAKWATSEPLSLECGGTEVTFTLTHGDTERQAQKLVKKKIPALTASLLSRIIKVEGHEKKRPWFQNLDLDEARDLLDAMDDCDGGIETQPEVECTNYECQEEFRVDLPFGRRDFWSPRRRR